MSEECLHKQGCNKNKVCFLLGQCVFKHEIVKDYPNNQLYNILLYINHPIQVANLFYRVKKGKKIGKDKKNSILSYPEQLKEK